MTYKEHLTGNSTRAPSPEKAAETALTINACQALFLLIVSFYLATTQRALIKLLMIRVMRGGNLY